MVEAPPIDPAIIEWLEQVHPNTLPREGTPIEELHKLQGVQRVINRIKAEYARQQEK